MWEFSGNRAAPAPLHHSTGRTRWFPGRDGRHGQSQCQGVRQGAGDRLDSTCDYEEHRHVVVPGRDAVRQHGLAGVVPLVDQLDELLHVAWRE